MVSRSSADSTASSLIADSRFLAAPIRAIPQETPLPDPKSVNRDFSGRRLVWAMHLHGRPRAVIQVSLKQRPHSRCEDLGVSSTLDAFRAVIFMGSKPPCRSIESRALVGTGSSAGFRHNQPQGWEDGHG